MCPDDHNRPSDNPVADGIAVSDDFFDPDKTARWLLALLAKLSTFLEYEVEISPERVLDVTTKVSETLVEMRDALNAGKPKGQGIDPKFPGAIAWSKQVATLTYYLFKFRPVTAAWPITQQGGIGHDGRAMQVIAWREDTSANERITLCLCFWLLASGVEQGKIWRIVETPKDCFSYCDAFECFIFRYWKLFYGDGSSHPSNLDYMLNAVKCDGLSLKAIAIIIDHILYGACFNAPVLARTASSDPISSTDENAVAGAGGANLPPEPLAIRT